MKKKRTGTCFPLKKARAKILMVMKLTLLLMCGFVFSLSAAVRAQDQMVTLKVEKMSFTKVISELKRQTQLDFFYSFDEVDVNQTISLNVKNEKVDKVLRQLLGKKFTWEYVDNLVIIKPSERVDEPEKKTIRLKGFVYDTKKQPMPGVTVKVSGLALGTSTNMDGWFSLELPMIKGTLEFSFVGYKRELLNFFERTAKDTIKIVLKEDSQVLDETVVVAFGSQKKESVVGAITTVRPMDLKSSNSDFTSSFAGRIPGIIAWQTGGMPAALTEEDMNTKFYIRGITSFQSNANSDPLILLDGVEASKLDLARLAPEDIESFNVMKDASATAMYGARGANGVILVTTKKGEEGSVYTTTRYEMIISEPTRKIDVVDPITYMKMYNQALLARSESATPKYSVERINRTASGKYPSWVYPANDWYSILFKNRTINHHAGLNIRGGSKVIQYYASVNYNRDEGMLKTDRLNDFDCNIKNNQISYRTNLNINLNAGIKLVINSSATLDKYHGPIDSQKAAYQYAFNTSPVDFAPTYPGDDTYGWPHLRFGTTASQQTNPYMLLQRGYAESTRFSTINRAEYIQNLSSLIKGLELRASTSLVQSNYYSTPFQTVPYKYRLVSYDQETGKHVLEEVDNTFARKTLEAGSETHTSDTRVTYEGRLLHTAAWGDHQTSLTGVFQMYERTFTPVSSVLNGMPQRNLTYSGRASYGYKDRYFFEASFGYNGSERFAKHNRMGFFPAVGGSWVVTNEPWMESIAKYVSFLKLRLSYGKVGNDGIISTPRYVYIPEISAVPTYRRDPEAWRAENINRVYVSNYGNENIQWEVAEQTNLGIELKLFGGVLEMQTDIYQELRHNIISNRVVIPANMGIEANPLDNIGETRSRGIDLSMKLQYAFNNNYWFILNNTLTYNKVIYKEIEEAVDKPIWQRKVGHDISQAIGYIAEGLFRDQSEIDNSPRQDGDVQPGDIKYRDINNDGVIDVEDATYIGLHFKDRENFRFSLTHQVFHLL